MSRPRAIYKDDTLMVTRRTARREFFLRPSRRVNRVLEYLLAVFAGKRGLAIHSVCVLSTHYHLVATDPHGEICDFARDFHSVVTRHINAIHGEFGSVWSGAQTSLVRCIGREAILDEIGYTIANPVSSWIVRSGDQWPGLRRAWPAPPKVIRRPEGFLDTDTGHWPETVVLGMARPPGFEELEDDALAALIAERIEAAESEARREGAKKGTRFLTRRQVLAQPRHRRAKSREQRFGISPRIACKDRRHRIRALLAERQWRDEYHQCRRRWLAGEREIVFPHGTYKLRVEHGVRVAERPG